jgi:hypothetical protein
MKNLREVVFRNADFLAISGNNRVGLGSHSLREFASTWAHLLKLGDNGKHPDITLLPDNTSTSINSMWMARLKDTSMLACNCIQVDC